VPRKQERPEGGCGRSKGNEGELEGESDYGGIAVGALKYSKNVEIDAVDDN
jgi:hypothetical protein